MYANANRRSDGTEAAAQESDRLGSQQEYRERDPNANLPDDIIATMLWLDRCGHSLLPLGGKDGKRPIVRGWKKQLKLPLKLVIDRMVAEGSTTFGIRLFGMLVVDLDSDNEVARTYARERFGESTVQTRTSRGPHGYFQFSGKKPRNVLLPGIAIDFKSGPNEYVVGAPSIRPDGAQYFAAVGVLENVVALPEFVDRNPDPSPSSQSQRDGRVPKGGRHNALKARAYQLAIVSDSFESLFADLLGFRDWEIDGPEDFPDAAIESMARWYWNTEKGVGLTRRGRSAVMISRAAIEELAKRGEGLAFAWHSRLLT